MLGTGRQQDTGTDKDCLSSALDSVLICQVDTKGTSHKFANKEYACDICESQGRADEESNCLGYCTMSAGKQLPMLWTRFFRICQSEKSRRATLTLCVLYVCTEE